MTAVLDSSTFSALIDRCNNKQYHFPPSDALAIGREED
jgi:hypothetical protein